jgi:uncharacterized protein YbjT (DUF2867 family)
VLVAGGTGYVGAEVVASLASAGHSLRVLVHTSEPALPEAAEPVRGDVTDRGVAGGGGRRMRRGREPGRDPGRCGRALRGDQRGWPTQRRGRGQAHGIRRIVHMSALGVSPSTRR